MGKLILNNLYSTTEGAIPSELSNGQIAINNTDEILYIQGKEGDPVPIYAGKWSKVPEQVITVSPSSSIRTITPTSPNVKLEVSSGINKICIKPTEATVDVEYNIWLSNCTTELSVEYLRTQIKSKDTSAPAADAADSEWTTYLNNNGCTSERELVNKYPEKYDIPGTILVLVDMYSTADNSATVYRYSIEKDIFIHARYCSKHKETLYSHANAEFKATELTKAANVVFVKNGTWVTEEGTIGNLTKRKTDGYTPVGIEVIPEGFNLKRDYSVSDRFMKSATKSKAVMMSLKPMSYTTPTVGNSSEVGIYWGYNGKEVTDNKRTYTSIYYIPMDKFSYTPINYSLDIPWTQSYSKSHGSSTTDKYYNIHSLPFKLDRWGSIIQNENYGWEDEPTCSTLDFDGYKNTQKMWDNITVSDWQTATTVSNSFSTGNYPAAHCCYLYSTEGTAKGDWYLPAQGELIFMLPFFNRINKAIDNINTVFGSNTAVPLGTNNYYWSSSELSSSSAFRVCTDNGVVGRTCAKDDNCRVRAFCPVG